MADQTRRQRLDAMIAMAREYPEGLEFACSTIRALRQEMAWALESLERLPPDGRGNRIDAINIACALDFVRAAVGMADRRLAYIASKYDEGAR